MNFLENDHNGLILQILDEEGIDYLKEYEYTEDRICYILYYSKYVNELFQNNIFLDLFLNTDISRYYASLKNLNNDTYDLIIIKVRKCLEVFIDILIKMIIIIIIIWKMVEIGN